MTTITSLSLSEKQSLEFKKISGLFCGQESASGVQKTNNSSDVDLGVFSSFIMSNFKILYTSLGVFGLMANGVLLCNLRDQEGFFLRLKRFLMMHLQMFIKSTFNFKFSTTCITLIPTLSTFIMDLPMLLQYRRLPYKITFRALKS